MKIPWLTSTWLSWKSGLSCRARTLSGEPVMKLSRARTLLPLARSASQRCEPMNPAPPEMTARGLLPANAAVGEAQVSHGDRVVDVSAVHDDRMAHELLDARHVELAELIPLRDQHDRVGAGRDLVRILQVLDVGQQEPRAVHRRRVVGAHIGSGRQQNFGDTDARRVT